MAWSETTQFAADLVAGPKRSEEGGDRHCSWGPRQVPGSVADADTAAHGRAVACA